MVTLMPSKQQLPQQQPRALQLQEQQMLVPQAYLELLRSTSSGSQYSALSGDSGSVVEASPSAGLPRFSKDFLLGLGIGLSSKSSVASLQAPAPGRGLHDMLSYSSSPAAALPLQTPPPPLVHPAPCPESAGRSPAKRTLDEMLSSRLSTISSSSEDTASVASASSATQGSPLSDHNTAYTWASSPPSLSASFPRTDSFTELPASKRARSDSFGSAGARPSLLSADSRESLLKQFPFLAQSSQTREAMSTLSQQITSLTSAPLPAAQTQAVVSTAKRARRTGKLCSVAGCMTRDKGGGLCAKHGGGRPCKFGGCDKIVAGLRYCSKHGGTRKKLCSVASCNKGDQGGGFCAAHGGGRRCNVANCQRRDIGRGLCWTHGGGRRCAVRECLRCPAIDGFCKLHYKPSC